MQDYMNIEDKKPKKRKKPIRTLLIILGILVAALVGCVIYMGANVSKIWGDLEFDENDVVIEDDMEDSDKDLPEVTYQNGDIVNIGKAAGDIDIMLIGVDNRDIEKFSGRSDVMIYMRVNTETKSLKLASFMRDTLVSIDGHGEKKLNTAYSFGSIDLLFRTYTENFGLTPDRYVVVNFYGMEDIINALGGVDIDVHSNELSSLNSSIREVNKNDPAGKSATVEKSGMQHLNGRQAVAYMRIRKPGWDSGRIERQQKVLKALFEEARNVSAGEIPALVNTLAQYVRTDVSIGSMMDIAKAVQGMQDSSLHTFRYPEEYAEGRYEGAGSVVQPKDFDTEYKKLCDFLTG